MAGSAIRDGTAPSHRLSLLDDELVLNVRGVVLQVHRLNVLGRGLDLGPAVDLKAQVLLDDVSVSVADADGCALFDNIKLLIKGHHLDAAVGVTDDALSDTVEVATIVSSPLADDADGLDTEVHVDAIAGFELAHRDEDGLAERGSLLRSLLLSLSFYHFALVFFF